MSTDRSTDPSTDLGRRGRATIALALVTGVFVLGLFAAAVRPAWQIGHSYYRAPIVVATPAPSFSSTGEVTTQVTPPAGAGRYGDVPSGGLTAGWSWVVMIALLIAGGIAVLVTRWARRPREQTVLVEVTDSGDVGPPQIPVLQSGAEEASRRLLTEADPTDAIIAAWLALESAAAASGYRREPAQTPTEFTAAVLTGTGVDPEPVQTLLRLYHRARFAHTGSRPDDLETARHCIGRLADAWRDYRIDDRIDVAR